MTTSQYLNSLEDKLKQAQDKAALLFEAVEQKGLIQPGETETSLSQAVYKLAEEQLGIKKYWHKRIVRAGANTVYDYPHNPPNLTIAKDDILFFDFGPIFEGVEADFGRTYVLGNDPNKHKLNHALPRIFQDVKAHYLSNPKQTGQQLFEYMEQRVHQDGWTYGGPHCGHLIGEFPHERRLGEVPENYICPENTLPMDALDITGQPRHWILEVHLISPCQQYGGFYEDLLTL